MAQQYKFSTAEGKHSSFYNRQVPAFQLMSQSTPFNSNMGKLSSRSSVSNTLNVEDDPRYSSDDGNTSYLSNSSNPPNRFRHANSKVRESQLSDILSHQCARDTEPDYVNQESVDQAAFERAERASSIIGGQSAGSDAYRTTAQAYMSGEVTQKKKISSKKMHYQNNGNVMSHVSSAETSNQHICCNSNSTDIDVSSMEDPLIDKVRSTLAKRGATGVLGMARLFRIMDDDDSKSLSMTEFKKAVRDSSLVLQDKELTYLFNLFDTDASGSISYDEFLYILRVRFIGSLEDAV
jgi:EF-hand domain pair